MDTLKSIFQYVMSDANSKSIFWAAVLAIFVEFLRRTFLPRGKIVWGVSHQHTFLIPGQPDPILVKTRDIWIQNTGRKISEDVEIVLNFEPQHKEIWPIIRHEFSTMDHNRILIKFNTLAVREYVRIVLFESRPSIELPMILSVRSKDGVAKNINMGPMQIFQPWVYRIFYMVIALGVFAFFYIICRIFILAF